MTEDNTVLIIAVLAVIASLAVAGFGYYSISPKVSGFALSSTGTMNLTITQTADINFTATNINWGSGIVNATKAGAVLDSDAGTVINGTWTAVSTPLVLENIGNVNVTLTLNSSLAAQFIGAGASYKLKIADKTGNSNACLTNGFSSYLEVSGTNQNACSDFGFLDSRDEIEIDVRLYIPYNVSTGTKGAMITATASAIPGG